MPDVLQRLPWGGIPRQVNEPGGGVGDIRESMLK